MAVQKAANVAGSYHHGDLRRTLLDSAKAIMAETGRWDFSLREVARHAGVSHNAPYRHFADRRALLDAVAVSGYAAMLEAGAIASVGVTAPGPLLVALGVSYVRFGTADPALYRLMFGQVFAGARGESSALLGAVDVAGQMLRGVIVAGACDGTFDLDPADDRAIMAAIMAAWSLVHGYTLMAIDGFVQRCTPGEDVGTLGEAVVAAFVSNLGRTGRSD